MDEQEKNFSSKKEAGESPKNSEEFNPEQKPISSEERPDKKIEAAREEERENRRSEKRAEEEKSLIQEQKEKVETSLRQAEEGDRKREEHEQDSEEARMRGDTEELLKEAEKEASVLRRIKDDVAKRLKFWRLDYMDKNIARIKRFFKKRFDKEYIEWAENIEQRRSKEWWGGYLLPAPPRDMLDPEGKLSKEEIREKLRKFFSSSRTNIDIAEYPELIDEEIKEVIRELNDLGFVKTTASCSGLHEGAVPTSAHFRFLINIKDKRAEEFLRRLDQEVEGFNASQKGVVKAEGRVTREIGRAREYEYNFNFLRPPPEWIEEHGKKLLGSEDEATNELEQKHRDEFFQEFRRKYAFEHKTIEEYNKAVGLPGRIRDLKYQYRWKKIQSIKEEYGRRRSLEYQDYLKSEDFRQVAHSFIEMFDGIAEEFQADSNQSLS